MKYKKIFSHILFIFISLIVLIGKVNASDEVYNSYKVGDKISYNDIEFYVIENSDSSQDYVTLLKANQLSKDEIIKYGAGHVNRYIKDSAMNLFYGDVAYYSSETCGYVNGSIIDSGCTTDYNKSDIKYIVDAWAKDKFKEDELKKDSTGYSARLITIDELTNNLGYIIGGSSTHFDYFKTNNTPNWVYKGHTYWSMIPSNDSTSYVWLISYNEKLISNIIYEASSGGVRPVVTIKKTGMDYSLNDYNYNKKTYKKGDVVYYKGNKYYVLKDSTNSESVVMLLKATPLTFGQVNKYGLNHINMYMQKYEPDSDSYYKMAHSDNGYGAIAYYSSESCKITHSNEFISSGCTVEYDKSDVKYVLDNWAKDFLNENDLAKDGLGYKYRLITLDELINDFGYRADDEGKYSYNDNIPHWIYGNYKYFTMTPADDGNKSMIVVDRDGKISASTYNGVTTMAQEYFGTIRPVITLKKSTGNEVQKEVVSVPDTLLSMPILGIIVGLLILAIAVIIICIQLRSKKKLEKF